MAHPLYFIADPFVGAGLYLGVRMGEMVSREIRLSKPELYGPPRSRRFGNLVIITGWIVIAAITVRPAL
jgi:hypothetical protein